MDANRRFAELVADGATGRTIIVYDVDFSSPIEVLRVMKAREDFDLFVGKINAFSLDEDGDPINDAIPVDLLLTPGALRDKAIEWMEAKK